MRIVVRNAIYFLARANERNWILQGSAFKGKIWLNLAKFSVFLYSLIKSSISWVEIRDFAISWTFSESLYSLEPQGIARPHVIVRFLKAVFWAVFNSEMMNHS